MASSKVKISVIYQRGNCDLEHEVGQSWVYDGHLPDICPAAWGSIYPYVRVLQFGGNFPWEEEGRCEIACPDGKNPVYFLLERIS